ncbi:MAG: phytanoyl-CoA dioxygenase family protein [Chitinophagales bacterium]|nr:phytanoyl-CoA dioxygenase family protein [Chitinophagales bacterium]
MNEIFKNKDWQKQFSRYGYVIIPSILNPSEIKQIRDTYSKFSNEITQSFHTSHFSINVNYKKTIQEKIIEIVYPNLLPLLNNYVPVFANMMVKSADTNNFLQMHADWTYVDETKFRSISAWIPLVDTNKQNGCFGVIDESHVFTNLIRGPRIQQNNFKRDRVWVKKYGKLICLKAGDAIIFDHALLHFSLANFSGVVRPAINMSMVPKDVEVVHYCVPTGANEIEKYIVDDLNFYLEYDNWERPRIGKPVEYLPIETIKYIDYHLENYGKTHLSLGGRFISFLKGHFV